MATIVSQRWASLLILALVIGYVTVWRSSEIGWSRGIVLSGLFIYGLLSAVSLRLSGLNAYMLYLIASVVVLLEISLRIWPGLTPTELMIYLEPDVRREVAKQRGLFTDMNGSGMLYYYRPNAVLSAFPDAKIDAHGFRNSAAWPNDPDLVLLGDSITIALGAKQDLGDLFRKQGLSVINLGMGGYGPQQYRDSFRAFIQGNGIKPKSVAVIFFIGNDFRNTLDYEDIVAKGENYRKYLGEAESPIQFAPYAPRLQRMFEGWRHYHSWRQRNAATAKTIALPYKTIEVNYLWPPPAIAPDDPAWPIVASSIQALKSDVDSVGACLAIYLMPSPSNLYSQFSSSFEDEERAHARTVETMSAFAKANGIAMIDLTPGLRDAIRDKFLFLSDSDTHFNSAGVQVLHDLVSRTLPRSCH